MQEEVTRGAVTLIVDGAKLSEQVFEKAVKKFLEEIQKSQKPKIYRGRQSLKQLASQNAGLANIEISDKNIKAFSRVAKKYHVDFALKKDTSAEQPRYLVFFKSRDADAITAAFQEFASRKMSREEMLIVDFQSRKREFGLLEAVGTTQKQLKIMLNREIGIYLGGSLAISLVCGSILSVIACRKLDAANHCITLELPWLFLLALIAVLAVIYLIFTAYAKAELKKAEILPAIREE